MVVVVVTGPTVWVWVELDELDVDVCDICFCALMLDAIKQ